MGYLLKIPKVEVETPDIQLSELEFAVSCELYFTDVTGKRHIYRFLNFEFSIWWISSTRAYMLNELMFVISVANKLVD